MLKRYRIPLRVEASPNLNLVAVAVEELSGGFSTWIIGFEESRIRGVYPKCLEALWSKDGRLALVCFEDGFWRIKVVLDSGPHTVYETTNPIAMAKWVDSNRIGFLEANTLKLISLWSGVPTTIARNVQAWSASRRGRIAVASMGTVKVLTRSEWHEVVGGLGDIDSIDWSPDESSIVVRRVSESETAITVIDVEASSYRDLARTEGYTGLDLVYMSMRLPSGPRWCENNTIYYVLPSGRTLSLYRVEPSGGAERLTPHDFCVHDFTVSIDGASVAYIASSPTSPCEVWGYSAGGSSWRVTRFSEALDETTLIPEKALVSVNGQDIPILYYPPARHEPGRRMPLAVLVSDVSKGSILTPYNLLAQLLSHVGFYTVVMGWPKPFEVHERVVKGVHRVVEVLGSRLPYVDSSQLLLVASGYSFQPCSKVAVEANAIGLVGYNPIIDSLVEEKCMGDARLARRMIDLGYRMAVIPSRTRILLVFTRDAITSKAQYLAAKALEQAGRAMVITTSNVLESLIEVVRWAASLVGKTLVFLEAS